MSWNEASEQCKKYGGDLPQAKTEAFLREGAEKFFTLASSPLSDLEVMLAKQQIGDINFIGLRKLVSSI